MLTQPNSVTLSAHFTIHKERLAATPKSRAKQVAQSVCVLCTSNLAIPDSATTTLRSVKKGHSLASAMKTIWYASPMNLRPTLQKNLLDVIATVKDLRGSTSIETHKLAALQALDPIIEAAAARHGVVWSPAAATLLAACPPALLPKTTDLLLAVCDPISFRVAVSAAVQAASPKA